MLNLLYRQLLFACSSLFCYKEISYILSSYAMLVNSVCLLKSILWEKYKRLKSICCGEHLISLHFMNILKFFFVFRMVTWTYWVHFWRLRIWHQSMKVWHSGLHHNFCSFPEILNKSFILFTLECTLTFKDSSSWFKPCSVN